MGSRPQGEFGGFPPFRALSCVGMAMSSDPRRLSALIETQTALAATGFDTGSLIATVANHVRELTGADASLVELLDADGNVIRAAADSAVAQVGHELDPDSLAGRSFHDRELLAWDGVNGEETPVPMGVMR